MAGSTRAAIRPLRYSSGPDRPIVRVVLRSHCTARLPCQSSLTPSSILSPFVFWKEQAFLPLTQLSWAANWPMQT